MFFSPLDCVREIGLKGFIYFLSALYFFSSNSRHALCELSSHSWALVISPHAPGVLLWSHPLAWLRPWVQVIHEYPVCLFSSSPDETRIAECRSVHAKIVHEWEGRADKHNTCTDLCSDVETSRKWFGEHWVVFMRFSLFRSCTNVAQPRGPTDQEY
jgi:hypothetical protein